MRTTMTLSTEYSVEKSQELAKIPWPDNKVMDEVMDNPSARPAVAMIVGKAGINPGKPYSDFLGQLFGPKLKNHVIPYK